MRVIRNRPGKIDIAGRTGPGGIGRSSVVTIGNFDGVHLGHKALINRCKDKAAAGDLITVVAFEPLPQSFFRPEMAPGRITTVYQKLSYLERAGVDRVCLMRFGHELASLSAREFVQQVLVSDLAAKCIVIGDDFRFGRGRAGDVSMLRKFGVEMGFEVETVAAVESGGQRISSSGIRELLAAGDFLAASRWLGYPFRMEGHVVPGASLGKQLGFATANLRIRARPSPLKGVFAVFARQADGRWLPSVSNLGCRPAVGGQEPLLEVHIFDFDEDLYGQRLEVQFVAKLRDELNFESIDDLVEQMRQDETAARACLAQASRPD